MQVGELYHSQRHGLVIIRKVTLAYQSMSGSPLYKVVFLVFADGTLWGRKITREAFHERFTSL